jgi:hypothetical protein
MASKYYRLLDGRALASGDTMAREDVLDAGAFETLECQIRVIAAATGSVALQHAATLEADAWVSLGSAVDMSSTTNTHVTHSNFLRYVRWNTAGIGGTSPVAIIDVIAKGS